VLATRLADAVPPAGGASVMGTGIVSIGLSLAGQPTVSAALLAITVVLWLGLLAVFATRRARQRPRWLREARSPASLTGVAGTAVLGSRLTIAGVYWAGWLLLAVAAAAWLLLVPRVLRYWQTPTVGVSFVLTVATESLAVLGALLALDERRGWLALAALVPLVLGVAAYLFALARVDLGQVLTGPGDHWIFGGALAIATLACARTTAAIEATGSLPAWHGVLQAATLVLWTAAVLWLPALVAGELLRPRLRYQTARWGTVFPFGMYAVCSIATGSVSGVSGIGSFGRAWIFVALAVWLVVFAGMLARGAALARSDGRAPRT
jgi:tellurite resistance protein TehA-like permease